MRGCCIKNCYDCVMKVEVSKEVDQRNEKSVLRWFAHNERMRNNKIVKRVYMGESVGSHLVG